MKKGADMKFDFKKRGRTLRQVPREEKEAALQVLTGFVTKRLAGKTQKGAFANSWFGSKTAVEYFTEVGYGVVFDRRNLDNPKAWKATRKLTTELCNAAWSAMGHWEREWETIHGKFGPVATESELLEPEDYAAKLVKDADEDEMDEEARQAADEKADEERRIGFEEVEELVKDNPKLKKYVKAVKELYDLRAISKRMNMDMKTLAETEAELLDLIEQYLKTKKKPTPGHARIVEM